MTRQQHIAYVSKHCPNCIRFMDSINTSSRARQEVRVVDIDTLSASARSTLQAVPTLQTVSGKVIVGSDAFSFLKAYESDSELGCYSGAPGALMFSDFEKGDGVPQACTFYETFEPLPT